LKTLLLVALTFFITLAKVSHSWAKSELQGQVKSYSVNSDDKISVLKHLENLSSDEFLGRKFSTSGSLKSQEYLVSVLEALEIPAFRQQYLHPFKQIRLFGSKQGSNIVAYVPGTQHEDKYIILSAHYDHIGTKGNKVFNGADDNASGTAALLHYAKQLSKVPLKHSIILLFTDGEEAGLLGAKAFIAQNKKYLSQFKLNVNLDMIAGSKRTKKLRYISNNLPKVLTSSDLVSFNNLQSYLKVNSETNLTSGFKRIKSRGPSLKRTNWRMASDHGIFDKAGVPFIYFGVGSHKNYHSQHDNYSNTNHAFYLASIDVIFQQLVFLDNAMAQRYTLNLPLPIELD
jgi:hypothetical protein